MPACLSPSGPAEALALDVICVMILLATTLLPVGLTPCTAITWPGNRRKDCSLETSRATLSPCTTRDTVLQQALYLIKIALMRAGSWVICL